LRTRHRFLRLHRQARAQIDTPGMQLPILILQIDQFLTHTMHLTFVFFTFFTSTSSTFASLFCFRVAPLHFLNQRSQLSVFVVLNLESLSKIVRFLTHARNNLITLQEFLLNNFEFLGISKSVFRLYHFFKLLTKANALIHVQFYFDLSFVSARIFDVTFEQFDFVFALTELALQLAYLSL